MSKELSELIVQNMVLLISLAGGGFGAYKILDTIIDKKHRQRMAEIEKEIKIAQENSVGKTAIDLLKLADKQLGEDIEDLKKNDKKLERTDEEHQRAIENLDKHYNEIFRVFFDKLLK